jgi:hypothetical protein
LLFITVGENNTESKPITKTVQFKYLIVAGNVSIKNWVTAQFRIVSVHGETGEADDECQQCDGGNVQEEHAVEWKIDIALVNDWWLKYRVATSA